MIIDADLAELDSTVLTGVTVGVGSQVLIFGNGATVLIQCPFTSEIHGRKQQGHGEDVSTSELLFDYLNCQVTSASLEEEGILVLKFEGEKSLRVIPECNGLESYVISTRLGICPVAVV
ncbi:hypothetical protein C9383_11940 [Pseudomonas palleroniana]|uniref:Uncharacterized protein n=1 Tax=Pseudomonas palleroniana TaxID=191390 RepID=A0A2L1J581_9PSED|nr:MULTISPECIES: hypothetical protein [Pseudomonas]AVE03626.1 hypothetical protein CYL20_03300 [Pseudomonas palleroniana]KAB0569164.1 hypothetical protein F7R03_06215 [Pseudomonas palleroniana]MBM9485336.1 hypothetical protein [Pseudomonas sp. ICBG1301]PTC28073.1 hypothetical protein C9383_11940 [Pseudomonas palleroniana]